jgi:hypothetical protein
MATNAHDRPATATKDRGSARGEKRATGDSETASDASRDAQLDLLTATAIGVAIGASAALLLRRGPRGTRPIAPVLRAAGRGAQRAGAAGADAAQWAWDRIPHEEIADQVQEYVDSAREAIERSVRRELKSLRKVARAQRRRLHL